jgi:hypothetical protein
MRHEYRGKGGYLPRSANSVAKPESPSFEGGEVDWKAGTLPTELLPLENGGQTIKNLLFSFVLCKNIFSTWWNILSISWIIFKSREST